MSEMPKLMPRNVKTLIALNENNTDLLHAATQLTGDVIKYANIPVVGKLSKEFLKESKNVVLAFSR